MMLHVSKTSTGYALYSEIKNIADSDIKFFAGPYGWSRTKTIPVSETEPREFVYRLCANLAELVHETVFMAQRVKFISAEITEPVWADTFPTMVNI